MSGASTAAAITSVPNRFNNFFNDLFTRTHIGNFNMNHLFGIPILQYSSTPFDVQTHTRKHTIHTDINVKF